VRHFWSAALGLDHLPVGPLLRHHPRVPVLDVGRYRAALAAGRPRTAPMFVEVDGTLRDRTRTGAPSTSTRRARHRLPARPALPQEFGALDATGTY
jgi:putative flavoprotein involved in K+ transport